MSLTLLLEQKAPEVLADWPHSPLLARAHPELLRAVSLDTVESHIQHGCHPPEFTKVVKDGQPVSPAHYVAGTSVNAGRLVALVNAGFTVNLREFQRTVPYLAEAVRKITLETRFATYVSALYTPPGKQGLRHHWDQFTGVIVQVAGRKVWPLWRPIAELPTRTHLSFGPEWGPQIQDLVENTPPDHEFELTAGDSLVVPRGWIHSPYAVGDNPSLHLTFAIEERTWFSLAEELIATALAQSRFRRAILPAPLDEASAEEQVRQARDLLLNFLHELDVSTCARGLLEGHPRI